MEETAADLGISTGTVKSQTSAGLARLRATPTPDGPGARASKDAGEDTGAAAGRTTRSAR